MLIMLSEVVAQLESSNNLLSMRYEPAWTPQHDQSAASYATGGWIDEVTAAMICKTSWGKYQIMGDNLYGELGYDGTIVDFLNSPLRQLRYFQAFLRTIGFSDTEFSLMTEAEKVAFGAAYNGNGPVYAQALYKAYAELAG